MKQPYILMLILALLFHTNIIHANQIPLNEAKAFKLHIGNSPNGEAMLIITNPYIPDPAIERQARALFPDHVNEILDTDTSHLRFNCILSTPSGVFHNEKVRIHKDTHDIFLILASSDFFDEADSLVILPLWEKTVGGFRTILNTTATRDRIGYATPIGPVHNRTTRSLPKQLSVTFHILEGHSQTYDTRTGKLSNESSDNMPDMVFKITPNNATMYGNQGSAVIEAYHDATSILLLETTRSGNKQVTIIHNRWNKKHNGFECYHIRNTVMSEFNVLIRSIIKGVATEY